MHVCCYTCAGTPDPCSWWRRKEWQIPLALKNLGGVRSKPPRPYEGQAVLFTLPRKA